MPRSIAAAIVQVVAEDAECRRVIPVVSPYNFMQRAAGGTRNLVNMTAEGTADFLVDATRFLHMQPSATKALRSRLEKVGEDEACTNVADVTKRAINAAIQAKRIQPWVTEAWTCDRSPGPNNNIIAYHSATAVKTGNSKTYVFDWHATLMLRNPLISRSLEEWTRGDDRYRSAFSTFQGWG